jgi:GT2 family glycosyltransferase
VTERARRVVHVPRVLYHWRLLAGSTAADGEVAKPYAYEAGTRAIQAHCDRIGLQARAERDTTFSGVYHLRPALSAHPSVSIVIPTRGDQREVRAEEVTLVTHCVRSIVERSSYPDYEIVVVADSSTPQAVLDELVAVAGDRMRIVPYDLPFSFSDKINTGALASTGEHVLMLNDDMEIVTSDWLERLVMYSSLGGVGAVGAKLLFGDGRLQHVGVTVDHCSPGHLFRGFPGDHGGYADAIRVAGNYSAVTGACLMTARATFDDVGGLSELFPLNFNDVDYCLKVQTIGERVVYDPDTVLLHFESSTRPEGYAAWELDQFRDRWRFMAGRDRYINPNFHPTAGAMVPPVYRPDGSMLI